MKLFFNSPGQNQNKQELPIHFVSRESSVQYPAIKAKAVPLLSSCNFTKYKSTKLVSHCLTSLKRYSSAKSLFFPLSLFRNMTEDCAMLGDKQTCFLMYSHIQEWKTENYNTWPSQNTAVNQPYEILFFCILVLDGICYLINHYLYSKLTEMNKEI